MDRVLFDFLNIIIKRNNLHVHFNSLSSASTHDHVRTYIYADTETINLLILFCS